LEPIGGGDKIDIAKGKKGKETFAAGGKVKVVDASLVVKSPVYPDVWYYLEPVDGAGDTLLNGVKVTLPQRLSDGDVIQVGDARLRYREQMRKDALVCRRGHDMAPGTEDNRFGHYTSEWVMVARDPSILDDPALAPPKDYFVKLGPTNDKRRKSGHPPITTFWNQPFIRNQYVWTDDYSNLFWVLRKFDDASDGD
jgi:hypothetical protein